MESAASPPAKRQRTEERDVSSNVSEPSTSESASRPATTSNTRPPEPPEEKEWEGAADSASYIPSAADEERLSEANRAHAASTAADAAGDAPSTTKGLPPWEQLSEPLPKSESPLDFRNGLFLAPMVRSGALPTRLMSLEYGAKLVWGPEIVDRAIMGCERIVDDRTGVVQFLKDGKQIFSTHPVERPYVIFQLGSANVRWAYEATRLITANDDVAGVDLNCGCPKPFSTIGGMGAHLLHTPELLCDVLRAMRKAAPPHVSVSCKIRLLPTKEATQSLVRMIVRTGAIDNLTLHCRTKEMRPREPALHQRLAEVKEVVDEETGGKLPLCLNGDAWDAREAKRLMHLTGTSSAMMARGAEANPSCFRAEGNVINANIIMPRWLRLAIAVDNVFGNTKFCLTQLSLKPSSSITPHAGPLAGAPPRSSIVELKQNMSQAKDYDSLARVFGLEVEEERARDIEELLAPLRQALERRSPEDRQVLPSAKAQRLEAEARARKAVVVASHRTAGRSTTTAAAAPLTAKVNGAEVGRAEHVVDGVAADKMAPSALDGRAPLGASVQATAVSQ